MYLKNLDARKHAQIASASEFTSHAPASSLYRQFLKRAFETFLILLSLPLVLLVIAACAVLVMLDGHGPFYTQERVGRHGQPLLMWKLRTMVPNGHEKLQEHLDRDPAARAEWDRDQKLRSDPRVTRFGRFLRKTSLDELPQLWNVLNGTMSLVGPRPIMLEQAQLYLGKSYFHLRPGITGFWQISDRNAYRFIDRARFDDAYNRSLSFKTDVVILWRTISVVLRGTGY